MRSARRRSSARSHRSWLRDCGGRLACARRGGQERVGLATVFGESRDPEPPAHLEIARKDALHVLGERLHDLVAYDRGAPRVRIGEDHRELVAADARRDVRLPDARLERITEHLQQRIADRAAEALIRGLESVELKEEDPELSAAT